MEHTTHTTTTLFTLGLCALLAGCGGDNDRKYYGSTTAPTTSNIPTLTAVPATIKGKGKVAIGKNVANETTYMILTDKGILFEIINPAKLKKKKPGKGRKITFTGKYSKQAATVDKAQPFELLSFKLAAKPLPLAPNPSTPTPSTPTEKRVSWKSYRGMSASGFIDRVKSLSKEGYRVNRISVNSFGKQPKNARYAATWIKDGKANWVYSRLTWSEYQAYATYQSGKGLRPASVEVFGNFPKERYAAVFVKDGLPVRARHRLTMGQLESEHTINTADGYRLDSVSGSGRYKSDQSFTAIWVKDGEEAIASFGKKRADFGQTAKAYANAGYRPLNFSHYGAQWGNGRWVGAWVKTTRTTVTRFDRNKNQWSSDFSKLKKDHYLEFVVESNLTSRDYAGGWVKQPK